MPTLLPLRIGPFYCGEFRNLSVVVTAMHKSWQVPGRPENRAIQISFNLYYYDGNERNVFSNAA